MKKIFSHLVKFDWLLIICLFLIIGIGLLSLYSISLSKNDFSNLKKQLIFIGIGVILMILASFVDWKIFRDNSYLILTIYLICLILLIGLFFFAPQIRGIKGWYKIGSLSFDPIGLTNLTLIILLAKFFSMRHIEMYRLSHIVISGLYTFFPFILISSQPNLGSGLILLFVWIGILIISGIKLRHFFLLLLCGILILSLSWQFALKDYQKKRIIGFLTPQIEPLGTNWSQNQAKIAIGSAGLWGKGFGNGFQTKYGFLTEPQTDFIFSSFAEEFGLIGIILLFLLYGFLIWRILRIGINSLSNFPRLFATGFAIFLMAQISIHIGMNLGILPVIGISLPLMSYGGSSLITIFIGIGFLESIKVH